MKRTVLYRYGLLSTLFTIAFASLVILSSCLDTVTLDTSGELLTEDIRVGAGAVVPKDSIVQVLATYKGTLTNNSVFDSTRTGQPARFLLGDNRLINGFDQGLRGMRIGGRRKITIPPRLGFGTQQVGSIPPNSTLIFDVELTSIERFIIEDLKIGTGDSVQLGKRLGVYYIGTFTNGREFDRTQAPSQPFRFTVGQGSLVRGFELGVLGMRIGGKRRVTMPSELGYGSQGRTGTTTANSIPANSTLVFEIELVSVD